MNTLCLSCLKPLDMMETKGTFKKINGEYVATETYLQGTCRTHGCRRHNITLRLENLAALTEDDLDAYERSRQKHEVK